MKYILVQWPESQELMGQPWFNECILANPTNESQDWIGSSAYFVPMECYITLYPTEFNNEVEL